MRVTVGKTLTIRGTNFSKSRKRNTVLFSAGKRSGVRQAAPCLQQEAGGEDPGLGREPAELLQEAQGHAAEAARGDQALRQGDHAAAVADRALRRGVVAACKGTDADDDKLPKDLELKYALDPCKADTDGDGSQDGWEYWAAKDLNAKAIPYPGKKPYPNPLQGGDTGYDFDGDSLTSARRVPPVDGLGPVVRARPGEQRLARLRPGLQRRHPGQPARRATPPVPAFEGYPGLAGGVPRRGTRCGPTASGATTSAMPTPTA